MRRVDLQFEAVADHAGTSYLRYSFTRGTEQEVEVLVEALDVGPGDMVLDVGCGPGRHSHALAREGIRTFGVDRAGRFVGLASETAPLGSHFVQGDARSLPVRPGSMDAVICLCQGGFGLLGGGTDEELVLDEISGALREGGRMALSAFSAYFAVRNLEDGEGFDAATGVVHERAVVRGEDGAEAPFDLWTTCFTPRELRLACSASGLSVLQLWSVRPGRYRPAPPRLDAPEWLVIAEKRAEPGP